MPWFLLFVAVGLLVADEGDEEAELGDLDGDGLDVHAVEAVFDEVELAAVVVVVVGEGAFEFLAHGGGVELGELGLLPALVVGVELAEDIDELVEDAHGEGAGTAGGVEDFQGVDGGDEAGDFGLGEGVFFLGVGEEEVQPGAGVVSESFPSSWLRFLHAGLFHEGAGEVGLERFVHHVVHDGARGVEGAGLLAGGGLGFLVVGGEEVLEDLAEQFGVEGDFLIDGGVLDDGELVAVQDGMRPVTFSFLRFLSP
jgi:hypothetical protein